MIKIEIDKPKMYFIYHGDKSILPRNTTKMLVTKSEPTNAHEAYTTVRFIKSKLFEVQIG